MIKKCIQCEKEFEAVRSDAKFCGATCKMAYKRSKDEPKNVIGLVISPRKYEDPDKPGYSKRTGLSYDMEEIFPIGNGEKKKLCPYCGEPTWYPPCAACCDEKRKVNPNWQAEQKYNAKWGNVCTLEEWKKYPNMCDTKAQQTAMRELYSNFTAKELVSVGVTPPMWKKDYKTYEEARIALGEAIDKYELHIEVPDYKKWK